jgi:hypothetical protein
VEEITRQIGAQIAQDTDTLKILLPELVATRNARLYLFGQGLADGCSDKQKLWKILRSQLEKTPPEDREINVFCGFLSSCAEKDPTFYQSTLDSLIKDKVLGKWFPYLQTTSPIDQRGVERLKEALDIGIAQIGVYERLAWGRAHESINDNDLADLLRKINSKEGGIDVVIEILKMRFHRSNEPPREYSENLIGVARDVLSKYSFPDERRTRQNLDYSLAQIVPICLIGRDGNKAAVEMCQHVEKAITDNRIYAFDFGIIKYSCAYSAHRVFGRVSRDRRIEDYRRGRIFSADFERRENP